MEQPTPPQELPKYLRNGLQKQDIESLRTVISFAEALLNYRVSITEDDITADDNEDIVTIEQNKNGSLIEKKIPCGKDCNGCPHGPYKYRVYRNNGKVKWEYIGRVSE